MNASGKSGMVRAGGNVLTGAELGAEPPTVTRLAVAATSISAALSGTAGRVRISGRLKNATGSTANLTIQVNGSSTGVSHQYQFAGPGAGAGAGTVLIGQLVANGYTTFQIEINPAPTSGGVAFKRQGVCRFVCGAASAADAVFHCSFFWNNDADPITAVAIVSGVASAFAAGSEIAVTEEAF